MQIHGADRPGSSRSPRLYNFLLYAAIVLDCLVALIRCPAFGLAAFSAVIELIENSRSLCIRPALVGREFPTLFLECPFFVVI